MIVFDHVTVRYTDAAAPTLVDVDLAIDEGEFVLLAGRTGVGKSTLLGAVNGLVPHFTGGDFAGRVLVAGQDTRDHPPREFAHLVGVVGQDPVAGFVSDTVEEELAYGMEQLGLAPAVMRKRVEDTLDLLGIADLRYRALRSLSGGQQQRVAIGSVLAAGARVLVLDEPTSALDPTSAEEVLSALLRLVHDVGVTALVAEHRLERVAEYADAMVLLTTDGRVTMGPPADIMRISEIAPPVVELGRLVGWNPLPLSVRDARRRSVDLRERLAGLTPGPRSPVGSLHGSGSPGPTAKPQSGLRAEGMLVAYGPTVAVNDVALHAAPGEVVVLMGRNGSGKSSLLWAITGVGRRTAGRTFVDGRELTRAPVADVRDRVRLVPQTAADLLYLDTVDAECAAADAESGRPAGACRSVLNRLTPGVVGGQHPRDLSEGQRLSLVLAVQLTADPQVLLLDEPTRGLDYPAKRALGAMLAELAAHGRSIVVSTHDVEFAAAVADRVVVLATGEVIADGPAAEVLASSPSLAPQVAKVLAPQPWLTVDQVAAAVTGAPA